MTRNRNKWTGNNLSGNCLNSIAAGSFAVVEKGIRKKGIRRIEKGGHKLEIGWMHSNRFTLRLEAIGRMLRVMRTCARVKRFTKTVAMNTH